MKKAAEESQPINFFEACRGLIAEKRKEKEVRKRITRTETWMGN